MAESASSLDPPLLVPNDVFGEAMDDHNEEADERESEDEVTSITDDDFLTNCLDPLVEDFGDQNHEETNALEPSESAQNIIGLITDGRFDTYDGFNDHLDIPSSYLNESIPSSLSKPVNFRDFEPWYENVSNLLHEEPEQDIVHDLVLNYLITEGYGEVAEALCEESGLVCPEDSNNVQDRMEIRKAIVDEGDIDRALTMLNTLTPGLLDQDPDVGFLIKQQQIIELVRNEKLHEALTLGEKCMAHASQMGESLIQEMEKTFSLLAFDEPEKSLYGSLMDPLHRQLVANSVNSAVLKALSKSSISRLEACFKLMVFLNYQLQANTNSSGGAAILVGTTGSSREDYEQNIAHKLFDDSPDKNYA